MNNTVKNLGESMDYIYQAATKTGAGTVTKLLGIGALQGEVKKHPEFQDSIDKANSAINSTIDSYFANDYNISSVLTQNTGKYSQESFTYDKDVAAKDKSKILLKINQSSGLPTIDKSGAQYKEQEQEARDWVRTQLLGKIDDKREVDVTGTIPYGPQPQQWQNQAAGDAQLFKDEGNFISKLYSGDDQEVKAAVDHFNGLSNVKKVVRNPNGIVITFTNGVSKPFNFKQNGQPISHDDFVRGASKLLLGDNANIKQVLQGAIGGKRGKLFNSTANASASAIDSPSSDPRGSFNQIVTAAPISTDLAEEDAVTDLTGRFGNFGFQFEEASLGRDRIIVTAPNGKKSAEIPFGNKKGSAADASAKKALQAFLIGNMTDEQLIQSFPQGGAGGNTNQAPR
jgi:hypothetical protein